MKIQEFLAKADEVKEINVVDHFDNGMIYSVWATSQHENVKNHAQGIIEKIVPTIEECYHIRYADNLYMVNKEVVDNVVQVIKNSTDYAEMRENLLNFEDMLRCGIYTTKEDNKIVNVYLSWTNWNSTCALRNVLKRELKKHDIKTLLSYEFTLYIKSEDCDDKERCKLFCEEQTRMRKMDRIFGLD